MSNFYRLLNKYDYAFPKELIAQQPARPRDSARLLVYDRRTGKTAFDIYRNFDKYLPAGAHLVLNQTKVLPARLSVKKMTGGRAKLLYIEHDRELVKVISDRRLEIGSELSLGKVKLTVQGRTENFYYLQPSFPMSRIYRILSEYGDTPIPPYIKNSPLSERKLREVYQTVFAKKEGSVAAPTASLHFTKGLLAKLKRKGIKIHFITLHVNMGTFAPLKEGNIKRGKLYAEYYEIGRQTAAVLNEAKKLGEPIIAVGTTVVRTLESAANARGKLVKLSGPTQLFIQEGYKFRFAESMATNFHVPRSSLLMLVSAFVGRKKLLALYRLAIKKRFRLFSFGDGMLIL